MKKRIFQFSPLVFLLTAAACGNVTQQTSAKRGAIVLGDTSTIVTETDTTYLSDLVSDITPKEFVQSAVAKPEEKAPEPEEKPATTEKTTAAETSTAAGFTIDFGQGVKVVMTGITTKEFQQQDPEKDAGVSYAVATGDFLNSNMHISGLQEVKIRQRYQSYLVLNSGKEELSLQNMGGYLSDWQDMTLKNSAGEAVLDMSGLAHLKFKSFSNGTLENAVRRAARSARMTRSDLNDWLQKIRKTRSANDAPCLLKLDNVQWQISGKTSQGRSFFKTIRMDI